MQSLFYIACFISVNDFFFNINFSIIYSIVICFESAYICGQAFRFCINLCIYMIIGEYKINLLQKLITRAKTKEPEQSYYNILIY